MTGSGEEMPEDIEDIAPEDLPLEGLDDLRRLRRDERPASGINSHRDLEPRRTLGAGPGFSGPPPVAETPPVPIAPSAGKPVLSRGRQSAAGTGKASATPVPPRPPADGGSPPLARRLAGPASPAAGPANPTVPVAPGGGPALARRAGPAGIAGAGGPSGDMPKGPGALPPKGGPALARKPPAAGGPKGLGGALTGAMSAMSSKPQLGLRAPEGLGDGGDEDGGVAGPGQPGEGGPGQGAEPQSGSEALARKSMDSNPHLRAASAVAGAVGLGGAMDKAKSLGAKVGVEAIKKTGVGRAGVMAVDTAAKVKKSLMGAKDQQSEGRKPGGRKLAVPLMSIVLVMVIIGGGLFAIQGSGGAAALMGAEETEYARTKMTEDQITTSLRMAEFYSWSTGEPPVPWELVGGILGVASAYGNRASSYSNEPTTRTGEGAPEGAQAYPVVNPPITGSGGIGPFLLNPQQLAENEASAKDVYENCTAIRMAEVARPQDGEFPDVANGDSDIQVVKADGTTTVIKPNFPWLDGSPKTCKNGVTNTTAGNGGRFDPPPVVGATTTTAPRATTTVPRATTTAPGPAPRAAGAPGDVSLPMKPISHVRAQQATPPTTAPSLLPPPLPPLTVPALPPPLGTPAPTTGATLPTGTAPAGGPPTTAPAGGTATTVPPGGLGPTTTTVFVPGSVAPPSGGAPNPIDADKVLPPRSAGNSPLIAPQDARATALFVMHALKTRAFQAFACFGKEGPKTGTPPKNATEEELQCWDYDPKLTKEALGWLTPEEAATSTTSSSTTSTTVEGGKPADPIRPVEQLGDLVDMRITEGAVKFWKALLKDIISCDGKPTAATIVVLKSPCGSVLDKILVESWRLADVSGYEELIRQTCIADPAPRTGPGGGTSNPTQTQTQYARTIIGVAKTEGLGEKAWIVALAVAFQESGIKIYSNTKIPESFNYPYDAEGSDGNSVGIFQQQVGYNWAPAGPDEIRLLMDPAYSAEAFFGGASGNPSYLSKGLRNIDGWENMPITVAAQKVQGSAYPDAYAKWEGPATDLARANADAPPVPLPIPFEGDGAGGANTGGGPTDTAPSVKNVLLVGDSILVGAKPLVESGLTEGGYTPTVDATEGSGLTTSVRDWYADIPAAVTRSSPDVLYIALGTNDYGAGSSYGANVARVMDSLPSTLTVVWVIPNEAQSLMPGIKAVGDAIKGQTQKYPNLRILESTPVFAGKPELMSPDGIHPNAEGQKAYASMILASVKGQPAGNGGACTSLADGGGGPVVPTGNIVTVRGIQVDQSIATQFEALMNAATAAGLDLSGSGWRDPAQQIALRRQNCGPTEYDIYQKPSTECSPPTAIPGTSMHERGLAIDFTCNGTSIGSRSGSCFDWLSANAAQYGFKNYPAEPWHWSTTGT